jgi:hypothetical protein
MGADFYVKLPLDVNELNYIFDDINKNMKYFELEKAFSCTNYESLSLQNGKIEV